MRILMTHWVYPPEFSGAALQGHRLSRELQRLGVSVQVLTGTHEKALVGADVQDGIPVLRVLRDRRSLFSSLRYAWAIERTVRRYSGKIDLVHTHGFHPAVNWAASAVGLPIITKITNQQLDTPLAVKRRRFGSFYHRLFCRCESVVASSALLEAHCRAAGIDEEKIVRIANGVDTELFAPVDPRRKTELRRRFHAPDDKVVLLTVGAVEYHKGLDLLIKALQALDDEMKSRIRVWVVGPTTNLPSFGVSPQASTVYLDQVRAMIREFGLQDVVRFMGRQANVHEYMAAADIYVHPSRNEGQPNAVLEAMACGLPVVANRLVGITDDLLKNGRYGLLVHAEQAPQFAAALRVLINNPALRSRMGQGGAAMIERQYSLKATAQRYLSLYSSIIHKRAFEEMRIRLGRRETVTFDVRNEQ